MPESFHDIVPAVESFAIDRGLCLWWLGGPSFVVRSRTTTIYVDPYYSDDRAGHPQGFERVIPNYMVPEDVTRADVLISTHNHGDHCDQHTLGVLCSHTAARIVAAPSSARKMEAWPFTQGRVDEFPVCTSKTYGDITIESWPSKDWDDAGAVTFVLSHGGHTIFAGGDTLLFDGLAQIADEYQIDLAVLALAHNRRDIIDADVYLDPPAFAKATALLRARKVMPIHWDIWKAWVEDPHVVEPHLKGVAAQLILPRPGELVEI